MVWMWLKLDQFVQALSIFSDWSRWKYRLWIKLQDYRFDPNCLFGKHSPSVIRPYHRLYRPIKGHKFANFALVRSFYGHLVEIEYVDARHSIKLGKCLEIRKIIWFNLPQSQLIGKAQAKETFSRCWDSKESSSFRLFKRLSRNFRGDTWNFQTERSSRERFFNEPRRIDFKMAICFSRFNKIQRRRWGSPLLVQRLQCLRLIGPPSTKAINTLNCGTQCSSSVR